MFEEIVQNITAVAVMIDGVPYAPVASTVEEILPVLITAGGFFSLGAWGVSFVLKELVDLVKLVIQIIRSRKESKIIE